MRQWVYRWLPIIFGCHCREDRSFFYRGQKFPICARCTGELFGMVFSIVSAFFYRVPIVVAVLLLIPMIVDGVIQMLTAYESNNRRRFLTGFSFGYGIVMLFVLTSIKAFQFGVRLVI